MNADIKRKIARIAHKYNLRLIILFGSQLQNKAGPDSDIDIAISGVKKLNDEAYASLCHDLGKTLGNYKVDLSVLTHANPLLLGEIAKNCRSLYEKGKGDFMGFLLGAMRKYADAGPFFAARDKYLMEKVRKYAREISRGDKNG